MTFRCGENEELDTKHGHSCRLCGHFWDCEQTWCVAKIRTCCPTCDEMAVALMSVIAEVEESTKKGQVWH